ncbi:hypothetical protein [Larkinella punicea]|uniref:Transmembrane Fragile-X-F protein n=1 Tax=Larkinella punicea TaxID=2315727 RepID=A0A368JS33_9BACT|nr:hypothetical protein [Larkinella punicea]RCR69413.1 hypothetical protein DUE52_11210 [Larkinella punicea]
MSFKALFLIGGLEFTFLVAILLKFTGLISLGWIWLFAPVWLPIAWLILMIFSLFCYLAAVAILRVFFNRLKSQSNQ